MVSDEEEEEEGANNKERKKKSEDADEMEVDDDVLNETFLIEPSGEKVDEWVTSLKTIATDMGIAKGYEDIGKDLDDVVGKLKANQRRIQAKAMADKQNSASQSKLHSFFGSSKKKNNKDGDASGKEFEL